MVLARTIALRTLSQRPGRTFFSVLGIAVGIATVVGIFTLDHNTLLGRTQGPTDDWQAEIEVSPSVVVEDPEAELREIPGVLGVTAAFQNTVALKTEGLAGAEAERKGGRGKRSGSQRVHLIALDAPDVGALETVQVDLGRAFEQGRAEAMIGPALAETYGFEVGSTIELARPRRARVSKKCVDGEWEEAEKRPAQPLEYKSFEVVGVLAREGVGRKASGAVVLLPFDQGEQLYSGTRVSTRYWLRHDPEVNLERLQASLGEAWSYDLKKSVIIGQAADERAFRNGVRFAGLLALVLGLFVIFHTLSMSLVERVKEVGVLNALGTTRAQIGRIFLYEAAVIAGLGGALGVAGGLVMARVLLRNGITTLGVGRHISVFEVPWGLAAPLAGLGVAIALLGSIYPLIRARNTSAVSALRGEETNHEGLVSRGFQLFAALLLAGVLPAVYFFLVPVVGEAESELVGVIMMGLGILALFVVLPLVVPSVLSFVCVRLTRPFAHYWPLAGTLAARTMTTTPARVAGAVAGIALVTAGFVGLRGMTNSLKSEIEVWGAEAFRPKVYASDFPAIEFDVLAKALHAHPEVVGVETNDARNYAPFLVIGVKEGELAGFGPCLEDPDLVRQMREEKGIVLSRRLAQHRDYEVGDDVFIEAASGDIETFPVIAITDAYGYFPHPDERLYGVVSDHWMSELFCMDTTLTSNISVRFGDDVHKDVAEGIMYTVLTDLFPERPVDAPARIETGAWLYWWHVSDIARDFVLFDIIIGLTVILAGIGVLNGQLLSALERAKELGVLKALGATRNQVAGMVMLESTVVGLLGGFLGIALGGFLTPFIVKALVVISGLPLQDRSAGMWFAIAWLGALATALLAGIYPIWRMNRGDAIAAVRTG